MGGLFGGLLNRDSIDIIFSGEVIFAVVLTICVFILVHSLLTYLKQSGPLYTRIAEIESEITVLQASIPVRLEEISALRHQMEPMEEEFKQLRNYHARLVYAERKADEEEQEKELEESAEKDREIKRQKLGLDRLI